MPGARILAFLLNLRNKINLENRIPRAGDWGAVLAHELGSFFSNFSISVGKQDGSEYDPLSGFQQIFKLFARKPEIPLNQRKMTPQLKDSTPQAYSLYFSHQHFLWLSLGLHHDQPSTLRRSNDEGLTLETSAFKLFTMANLPPSSICSLFEFTKFDHFRGSHESVLNMSQTKNLFNSQWLPKEIPQILSLISVGPFRGNLSPDTNKNRVVRGSPCFLTFLDDIKDDKRAGVIVLTIYDNDEPKKKSSF